MHHIQRKTISKLIYAPTLGYAQMRPIGVESNHFAYHLDQLIKAGYITKNERKYSLTTKGKTLADRVSHEKMDVRVQPQIVTSIYIKNDAGKTSMFKHNFQPYLGLYGAPQGRLHLEEKVDQAALRELKEKTGLEKAHLTHRGMIYVHILDVDEMISKLLLHIFTGTVSGEPALSTIAKSGEPVWMNSSELTEAQCMPGFKQIEEMVAGSEQGLFFAEIDARLAQ